MLACVQAAIDADPKNPLAKFEKAAVLISQEQYQPALAELEALKVGQSCTADMRFLSKLQIVTLFRTGCKGSSIRLENFV